MSKYVILLNAPPYAGKDTAARYLKNQLEKRGITAEIHKFAAPLKDAVHRMWGLNVPTDHFESTKDQPCELMANRKPRQEYIDISEKYAKPRYGRDFWAVAGANAASSSPATVTIFSDCGFQVEADTISARFGRENVYLYQITRPGTSFEGDSREHVFLTKPPLVIENDSTYGALEDEMTMVAVQMIGAWQLR